MENNTDNIMLEQLDILHSQVKNVLERLSSAVLNFYELENRIKESEDNIYRIFSKLRVLEERFEILFSDQAGMKKLLLSLTETLHEKKPHKCPMCDGKGKTKHPLNGLVFCKCDCCEGKGIVWGVI